MKFKLFFDVHPWTRQETLFATGGAGTLGSKCGGTEAGEVRDE